ncbi:MAG TPA: diguanylate cyclase [Gammaproteobacteria bacterium]|nr:diguanylate cyclase [Gammaproteobacteria bacterium]
MSNAIEELKIAYLKSLPKKVQAMRELMEANHREAWSLLHRKAHSLRGSAGTYGFENVSTAAATLEALLDKALKNDEDPRQEKLIWETFAILESSLHNSSNYSLLNLPYSKEEKPHDIFCLLTDDSEIIHVIRESLNSLGFTIYEFTDSVEFENFVRMQAQYISLIDLQKVDPLLENFLKKNAQQVSHQKIVFTMDTDSDLSTRLRTIRFGSRAFFLKPFHPGELIIKIEQIREASSQYRILILDDDPDTNQWYSFLLSNSGFHCKTLYSYEHIESEMDEFKPDLVLMDMYMPEVSGIELAAVLRQRSVYEGIPIVFLSSEENKHEQIRAMRFGADDFIVKSHDPRHLIDSVYNRILRYKAIATKMVYDGLTAVYNHAFVMSRLEVECKLALRLSTTLSIAILDLDNFKGINDTYGHPAGDHVLKTLCFLLRNRLRKSDIVGRYGGEEFIVILPHTKKEQAEVLLNVIKSHFNKITFSHENFQFTVSFSAGIAEFPREPNVESLIQSADEALYSAKNYGKNQVCVYNPFPIRKKG